ncbi:lysophospholipid acyltransferase family protein [Egibacter rhizosphaerae]|uniref:lysophospholipid acyltransferase family protein n=1 Tax=Egibacter rhizosphaerae TaxID=1670831 RepID=UPI0013F1691C|nr:lysophospholipid acyltransferase family protein [Egibacter rhizosphaerae]
MVRVLDLWVRGRYRLRVRGLGHIPPAGPALLAPNHVSYEDPVVMAALAHRAGGRRVRGMVAAGAFEHSVAGPFLRVGRQIPVQRGRGGEALAGARRRLADGELVLLYPEGRITVDRPVEARPGIGRLAIAAGVPIVPIASWGLARAGEGQRQRAVRTPAGVAIGPPLWPPPAVRPGDRDAARVLARTTLSRIRSLMPAARLLAGAEPH